MRKTPIWDFSTLVEQNAYGTSQGVSVGDLSVVVETVGIYMWNGSTWQPFISELETLLEMPWSTLPNQTLVDGVGANVINGIAWTGQNIAVGATQAEISNGNGLRMTATVGTSRTWTTAATTSPAIRILLSTLLNVTSIDWTKDLWVWFRFSAFSVPLANNTVMGGLYAPASAPYIVQMAAAGWTNTSTVVNPYAQRGATLSPQSGLSGGDVVVLRYNQAGTTTVYHGTSAGGEWPTRESLQLVDKDVQPEGSSIVTLALLGRTNVELVISPMTRAVTGTPSFTLADMMIQSGP